MRLRLGRVSLKQQHAERQQERQQPLRIQHERRAHIVGHRGRENAIQSQPDESLDELMNGEQRGQRREKQFAPVLHLRQCDDADGAKAALPTKFAVAEKHTADLLSYRRSSASICGRKFRFSRSTSR